jgi:hypothetical protein
MNRSNRNRNSEKTYLNRLAKITGRDRFELKTGGISDKPPVEIVDSGASWRRFFCAAFRSKALITIFSLVAHSQGTYGFIFRRSFFSLELSQTLTKFQAFLEDRK